ncbi:ribosomal L27 protein-domain-containing protein [Staphylotrichum tortipilum]|uniref:Large ribosomal subunit protein bL27m n=1 Tax=Staphylotrichum tortipilum TaxID=2831512 RepID=A0AAN6MSA8_9PEZI|nr:ribosomal L27 protein-domain-containing protein [Staphylotrichum longicolle]
MASATNPTAHFSPGSAASRPKGILKNPQRGSPPVSPTHSHGPTHPAPHHAHTDHSMTPLEAKELTIANTQYNAGHRRSSSAAGSRPGGSRRQSSLPPNDGDEEQGQRLKWDEANLYLTEQERSSTMKINEPKTPYAKHYDPAEDPSDDDEDMADQSGGSSHNADGQQRRRPADDEIPRLSLGEPEEDVPQPDFAPSSPSRPRAVHVDSNGSGHDTDGEEYLVGLSAEEREKHRRFEEMRKKHYEMRNVAALLGHPEEEAEEDDEDNGGALPVPPLPGRGPLRRVAASSSRPFSALLRTTIVTPTTTAASLEDQFARLRIASPAAANAAVEGRRYASVKSQGAYRLKSKKTIPKKMGAKKTGDQYVITGNIIYKQRGTVWHPGENTIMGRNHTIHAAVAGYVKYYRDPKRHPKRQYIGVVFNREDKLPYPESSPRRRKLHLVAVPRQIEAPVTETTSPSGIPLSVTRHAPVEPAETPKAAASQQQTPVPEEPITLTDGNSIVASLLQEKLRSRQIGQAKREAQKLEQQKLLDARKNTRVLHLQPNYGYRETNWEIGRLVGDAGTVPGTEKIDSKKAKFRLRRRKRMAFFRGIKNRKLDKAERRANEKALARASRERKLKAKAEEAAATQNKAAGEAATPAKPKADKPKVEA